MWADVLTDWTLDPLQLAPVVLAGVAYATARPHAAAPRDADAALARPPLRDRASDCSLLAFASPIAAIGEQELFSFHMLQHVLIGDLAPLCLLAGLNGPMLRPLLALRPVERLRVLANPLVALPIWATNLYVWHLPFLYEAAVEHSVVHALEHVCFFSAGDRRLAARARDAAGAGVVRDRPRSSPTSPSSGSSRRCSGTSSSGRARSSTASTTAATSSGASRPLQDQGLAGAVMMIEGSLVTITALAWLFLRLAQEGELRQELLERGLDPRAVRRAVRYGRAQELAERR